MRHINRRQPRVLANAANFVAHFEAELGVEIRERLVEQEAARTNHQRARQGHTLLLATRELGNFAVGVLLHLHRLQRSLDLFFDLRRRHAPLLEAERHIFRHSHVGPQRVALKHHSRVALVRRDMGHILIAEKNLPRVGHVKTRNVPEQGRLATTARTQQKK